MTGTDWDGRVIDGRYVVEALIGRGGMGVVLAARHKFTGARVAVKMVRADLGLDAEIEGRFLAEARMPATIGHRSVVQALDAGKTPEGELYLVMELLSGRSLRAEIMRGVGAPAARRIGMELLDVLAAAHARGIVHRDVKPENVFLVEPSASVKLLDFGITKILAGASSILPRTAAGVLLGTLEYMPPEQLADASTVDARADLWAVSVILYEMLAGRRPHRVSNVEEMFVALIKGRPDPIRLALPSATPDIEAFFARALAREPEQRFATAADMAMAFAKLPLAAAAPRVAKPSAGNVTMATGVGATGAGTPSLADVPAPADAAPAPPPSRAAHPPSTPPSHGHAVLTPFEATPALAIVPPPASLPAAPSSPAPRPAGTPGAGSYAAAGTPRTGTYAMPATPGTAIPARAGTPRTRELVTAAETIELPATRPRRIGLIAGALATVALVATIVVASTRHSASSTVPAHDAPGPPVASAAQPPPPAMPASPASPAASPTPSSPTPAPTSRTAAPTPAPAHNAPKHASSKHTPPTPGPSTHAPQAPARRSDAAPSTNQLADPYALATPPAPSKQPSSAPTVRHAPAAAPTAPQPPAPSKPPPSAPTGPQPPAAAPTAPQPPPTALQPTSTCSTGCQMLASCHLGSRSCEADCAQNSTISACMLYAGSDCNRFAACSFASSCAASPTGQHSCSEAMDCEATCHGDSKCICGCVATASSKHAVALLAYNDCARQCRTADCITQRCAAEARACRSQ